MAKTLRVVDTLAIVVPADEECIFIGYGRSARKLELLPGASVKATPYWNSDGDGIPIQVVKVTPFEALDMRLKRVELRYPKGIFSPTFHLSRHDI